MKTKTMTLKLTDKQLNHWRAIAKKAGYVMERGPMPGEGSIQQLMEATANGLIRIIVSPV